MTITDTLAEALHYYQRGELAPAEEGSLLVLAQAPNHSGAFHLLGLIAGKRGELDRAAEYLNRSLLCDSTNALAWCHLGDVHLGTGDVRAGIANYEQALRLQPRFAEAYNNLAVAWLSLREWARAAESCRQAVELMPALAVAYNNWGLALKGESRLAEAKALFERAVELEPDNADFAFNLAFTLHNLGETDRAAALYRLILCAHPERVGSANNLATILKEQGLLDEAVQQFRDILKRYPDYVMAHYSLSEFAAEGHYRFTAAELEHIKGLIVDERYTALERSFCCFAAASVLNQEGAYDEAFGYYQRANDLRRGVLREQNEAFDAHEHEALVDHIIATQDEAYFARTRGWGVGADLPVFIIGMPRSGSTLVEQILASHPSVFGAGELGEVPEYFIRWAVQARPELPLPHGQGEAASLARDFLERAQLLGKGAARVVLKNLDNYLHLGAIATLLPGARVIHCRRDPLDVCLSCYFQNFNNVNFAWSLEDIGACYRAYDKLMAHWRRALPLQIHEVRYEELVGSQEAVTRRLLAFCGLDWDERCLAFFKTRRVVRTASCVQVRRPISSRAIGRWQHYRAHLGPLLQALGLSIHPGPQAWPALELAPTPAATI